MLSAAPVSPCELPEDASKADGCGDGAKWTVGLPLAWADMEAWFGLDVGTNSEPCWTVDGSPPGCCCGCCALPGGLVVSRLEAGFAVFGGEVLTVAAPTTVKPALEVVVSA